MPSMSTIFIAYILLCGIPMQIIDYKHMKKRAYERGNVWGYYTALSKSGSVEAKFMVWSSCFGIGMVVGLLGIAFDRLVTW